LVFLWNLLNQIRNTDREKEEDKNDFLQSPVWSEEIQDFFDSRKADDYKKKLKKKTGINSYRKKNRSAFRPVDNFQLENLPCYFWGEILNL